MYFEVDSVEIARPIVGDSGIEYQNDLTKATFDVAVDVGPTSSSKKNATVRALTAMLPLVPDANDQQVISSMIMLNMDGEGISEVRDYYRQKLVRMGVVDPTEEEKQQLIAEQQNQQPDPNTQYLQAAAAEAQSKAMKAQADTYLTAAKTEQTKADTAKTLSDMEIGQRDSALNLYQQINQNMASAQPMSEEFKNV